MLLVYGTAGIIHYIYFVDRDYAYLLFLLYVLYFALF